jgi:hypothetical protein
LRYIFLLNRLFWSLLFNNILLSILIFLIKIWIIILRFATFFHMLKLTFSFLINILKFNLIFFRNLLLIRRIILYYVTLLLSGIIFLIFSLLSFPLNRLLYLFSLLYNISTLIEEQYLINVHLRFLKHYFLLFLLLR